MLGEQEESYSPMEQCSPLWSPCSTPVSYSRTHQFTCRNAAVPHAYTYLQKEASPCIPGPLIAHMWTPDSHGGLCVVLPCPHFAGDENQLPDNTLNYCLPPPTSGRLPEGNRTPEGQGATPSTPGTYLPTSHHGKGHLVPKVKFAKRKLHGSLQALGRGRCQHYAAGALPPPAHPCPPGVITAKSLPAGGCGRPILGSHQKIPKVTCPRHWHSVTCTSLSLSLALGSHIHNT